MIAVLTGDIINSTKDEHLQWLDTLKKVLSQYGKEPKNWEIFRGDSFQLEISPEIALYCAIHIKAAIKQQPDLDVRIAIGIGNKIYSAEKITQSNGEAFIFSGESFDKIHKDRMVIKTPWKDLTNEVNLYLDLALLTMNSWLPATAIVVKNRNGTSYTESIRVKRTPKNFPKSY